VYIWGSSNWRFGKNCSKLVKTGQNKFNNGIGIGPKNENFILFTKKMPVTRCFFISQIIFFPIFEGSAFGLETVDARCHLLWDLYLFFHRVCVGWSIQDLGEFDPPCSLLSLHPVDEVQLETDGENGAIRVGLEINLR